MTVTWIKKQPVGKVEVQPKGKDSKLTEIKVGEPVLVSDEHPMANVGMKVGITKNLGNYESVRVDVSLFLPCEPDAKSVDDAFETVSIWCDLKMEEINKEYEDMEEQL
jgi:hypothetical protein